MEANEAHELQEHAHHEQSLRPVAHPEPAGGSEAARTADLETVALRIRSWPLQSL